MSLRIPILTYHSLHAPGDDYHNNDHVALATDLQTIRGLGLTPISLESIARWLNPDDAFRPGPDKYVGISFDDGCDHDFVDFSYPGIPTLVSMYNILRENNSQHPQQAPFTATSFVIASPAARTRLDQACIAGRDQWRDNWWQEAEQTGLLRIANHSWDHTHPELDFVAQHAQQKGDFYCVDNWHDADMQILQAEWYIRHRSGSEKAGLFAYPYGHVNDFLAGQYFPHHQEKFLGAFSTAGDHVSAGTNRWRIPRFVCGDHWNNPQQLEKILRQAG